MSVKLIRTLAPQLAAAKTEYNRFLGILDSGTPLTEDQETAFTAAKENFFGLAERITGLQAEVDKVAALNAKLAPIESSIGNDDKAEPAGADQKYHGVYTNERPKLMSLGQAYVESDAWKTYLKTARGHSGGDADFAREQFALISSKDVGGKPIAGFWKASDAAMPVRRTPLLDACGSEQVGSGEFWWIEWPLTAPTADNPAEGQPADETSYPPVARTGSLGKAVAQLPVTEEFLEDNVRMRSIIDGGLADGVRQNAEADAAATLVAASLPASPGTGTLLEEIRRGVGTVQNAGFDAMTVVLNPADYAEIDIDLLTRTLNGARANSPLWALNVVPAGAVAAGTAYVGDFLSGARVFWRSGVRLSMTDSHEAEFVSGILRIKAVQRIEMKVVRPEALVKCVAALP